MHTLISDVKNCIFKFLKFHVIIASYEIARPCEIEDSKRQTQHHPQHNAFSNVSCCNQLWKNDLLSSSLLGFETCYSGSNRHFLKVLHSGVLRKSSLGSTLKTNQRIMTVIFTDEVKRDHAHDFVSSLPFTVQGIVCSDFVFQISVFSKFFLTAASYYCILKSVFRDSSVVLFKRFIQLCPC